MSSSIYNVPNWAATTNYSKNDIVVNNNLYYYALSNFTSASSFAADSALNLWGGQVFDNGETKKFFIWRPAYNHSTDNEPRIKEIKLGDGYSQKIADGINNILPQQSLEFESDLSEVTAILHFLENCSGTESFLYIPPAPRGILSRWTCRKWTDAQPFYNNYRIQCVFERSVT